MDPAEKKRKLLIGGALIVTLIAVVLVEEDELELDVVEFSVPHSTTNRATGKGQVENKSTNYLAVDQLGQREFDAKAGDIFRATSWIPQRVRVDVEKAALARQAAREAAPPPAQTAPPLQFKYIGKVISGNNTLVFLNQSGENLIAKVGEAIDDQYRIDELNEEAIIFTYLPLNIKQTLTLNNT